MKLFTSKLSLGKKKAKGRGVGSDGAATASLSSNEDERAQDGSLGTLEQSAVPFPPDGKRGDQPGPAEAPTAYAYGQGTISTVHPGKHSKSHISKNDELRKSSMSSTHLDGMGVEKTWHNDPPAPPGPLDEPTWKVLPAVFKRYRLEGDWRNHIMVIAYGPAERRTDRYLGYDEKPLLIFTKLKDENQQPNFSFIKMSEIQSPVALACQRYAARRAAGHIPAPGPQRSDPRDPRPPLRGGDYKRRPTSGDTSSSISTLNTSFKSARLSGDTLNTIQTQDSWSSKQSLKKSAAPSNRGVSYAVAIFPWMAEREDEFDVEVGDAFVIISRTPRWWVVQRDDGSGAINDSPSHLQGWVPSGSLLEINAPLSFVTTETIAARTRTSSGSSPEPAAFSWNAPISPQHMVTSSYPGICLKDFAARGEEEIGVWKDEVVGVYKRYGQWCYVVKDGGDRGWVPGWYLAKNGAPIAEGEVVGQ